MKIYITGLPSGYDVEHLVRIFYPMAPLTLTPPEDGEDCLWASCGPEGLRVTVRENGRSKTAAAPLPAGETPEFALASLTYGLLREWTGLRPPWGKMTGVRPVRLIHDKRAAGWTEAEIDWLFLERFDCSEEKYRMAKAIAGLQEPILRRGSQPRAYSLYIGIPFCPSRCSYCSFVSCNLDRDRRLVQPYVDCLCRELEAIRRQADQAGLQLQTGYLRCGSPHLPAPGPPRPPRVRGRPPRLHRRRKAGRHQGVRGHPHFHQSPDLFGRGAGPDRPPPFGPGYSGLLRRRPGRRPHRHQYGPDRRAARGHGGRV